MEKFPVLVDLTRRATRYYKKIYEKGNNYYRKIYKKETNLKPQKQSACIKLFIHKKHHVHVW